MNSVQIDTQRLRKYADQIITETDTIRTILEQNNQKILKLPHLLRSLKYSIIVISESIANSLQHILAKKHQVAVSGYREVIVKAREYEIISLNLLKKLQPFLSFRNMLVHHYWKVDDTVFLENIRIGISDFLEFVNEINHLIKDVSSEKNNAADQ